MPQERFDDLVTMFQEDMGPRYADARGFRGFTVVSDRSKGQVFGISFWATEADRDGASELGRALRRKVMDIGDLEGIASQLWEVAYFDVRDVRAVSAPQV
ncbi:MAG TPA: hypothetical protein VHX88_13305 [Solirubrobacteraceae bacterium]|nr:hypothetical protein [Solirubrobacteraceae bacterium]